MILSRTLSSDTYEFAGVRQVPHLKLKILVLRSLLFRTLVTLLSGLINLIVTPMKRNQYFFSNAKRSMVVHYRYSKTVCV